MVVHVFDRGIAQLAKRRQAGLKNGMNMHTATGALRYVAITLKRNARHSQEIPVIPENGEFVAGRVWGKIADPQARTLLSRSRSRGVRAERSPPGVVHREGRERGKRLGAQR